MPRLCNTFVPVQAVAGTALGVVVGEVTTGHGAGAVS